MTKLGRLAKRGEIAFSDGYRTKKAELSNSGYVILRAADIVDGRVVLEGKDFVDSRMIRQIGSKVALEGDVILTTKGTVGRTAFVNNLEGRDAVYSPQVCYFRFPKGSNLIAEYLRYWFSSVEGLRQIRMYSGNTDMAPYLSLRDIAELDVRIPPRSDQLAICEVLGALDDRIAANHRAADSAGALQRALWAAAGTNLQSVPLISVASPHLGGTPARTDAGAWSGPVKWASVRDLTAADSGILLSTAESISVEASRSARRLGELPEGTVVLTARGTVGHVTVLGVPAVINQSAYAFVPEDGKSVVLRLGIESLADSLKKRAHGSVFSTVTMDTLQEAMIPDFFSAGVERLLQDLESLESLRVGAMKENLRLAATRDELLPLLMSGKITVKDAENAVEGVL